MNLECFDGKCVRIVTVSGKVYEGHATHNCAEYNWIECGVEQESLDFGPLSFFENEIADVISQEDVNGPFGHFSEAYGLLEKECLELGSDYIGEVFYSEDEIQILRMLICMDDHFQSLKERAIPGMAPWHKKTIKPDEVFDDEGVVYLGELENDLRFVVKCMKNDEIVERAKDLLDRLTT